MTKYVDADVLMERFVREERACDEHGRDFTFSFKSNGVSCAEWWTVQQMLEEAQTLNAIPLDTKIVVQTYDEEHEEWSNKIMTIQEFLDSGMCEIYREELRNQYE